MKRSYKIVITLTNIVIVLLLSILIALGIGWWSAIYKLMVLIPLSLVMANIITFSKAKSALLIASAFSIVLITILLIIGTVMDFIGYLLVYGLLVIDLILGYFE